MRINTHQSTASLLYGIMFAQIKPTFYKINIHSAMTATDLWNSLEPVFSQAKVLQETFNMMDTSTLDTPFVTVSTWLYCRLLARYLYTIGLKNFSGAGMLQVFLDELNTSSCLGVFKEIIVDRTFDGNVSHPLVSSYRRISVICTAPFPKKKKKKDANFCNLIYLYM